MYIIYRALLSITYFGIFVHCLANFNNNGISSSTSVVCSSGNCRQRIAIIAGSMAGGGIGMILFVIGIIFCCRRYKDRPSQTNPTFIIAANRENNKHESYDIIHFPSGIWLSRYLKLGKWDDFHRITLSFDSESFKITGSGSDNIGMFIIDGIYSITTGRIGLTKTYQLGTGNRLENFGHQVIIQLTWNSKTQQFEGKQYTQTKTYRGVDRFELKFSQQQQ